MKDPSLADLRHVLTKARQEAEIQGLQPPVAWGMSLCTWDDHAARLQVTSELTIWNIRPAAGRVLLYGLPIFFSEDFAWGEVVLLLGY